MKKIAILFFTLLLVQSISAQSFEYGDKVLNLGLGISGNYFADSNVSLVVPPISVSYEYAFTHNLGVGNFGVGVYAGMLSVEDVVGYVYTSYLFGLRGNYHFYKTDKIDTYGGLFMGASVVDSNEPITYLNVYNPKSGVVVDGFLGLRYYLNQNMAVFSEIGFGISYLTVGISYKL